MNEAKEEAHRSRPAVGGDQDGGFSAVYSKRARYSTGSRRRLSSAQHWSSQEAEPTFLQDMKRRAADKRKQAQGDPKDPDKRPETDNPKA